MAVAGKHVLVTAAARGIGLASVRAFARHGAKVLATDVDADALDAMGEIEGVTRRVMDVTDASSVAEGVRAFSEVAVLFNCAGVVHGGPLLDCTDAELDIAYDVNVKGMVRVLRAVLPGMVARGEGSIVNMASVAGSVTGVANRFVYGVTKAAVVGLTKSVAADYVAQGIRCNAICPGTVDSPSLQDRLRATGDLE